METQKIIQPTTQPTEKPILVKKFTEEKRGSSMKPILIGLIIVLLGVGTGYVLSSKNIFNKTKTTSTGTGSGGESGGISKGTTVGISDEKTFKDSAEGKLETGGVNGEGSHHLVRPGGESQNVYLTSSIVDLDLFLGREVKVWGETFSAKKAGWLMDVGKLQVLD